jgi:hypothetical protein
MTGGAESEGAEPDPVADLAAQLEELRGQWARSQGEIGALRERLNGSTGQVMLLLVAVKRLARQLDEALAKKRLAPPPAPWWCVGEAEGRAMLSELRRWVEDFARKHYPAYMARLPACWLNHPEAVWELSTLKAEWEHVYGDEDNRDLAGALWWHERWLPGVIARLEKAITCDLSGCRRAARPS